MPSYFDNAATTPLDPRVLEAMLSYLKENFGNPSSIHHYGIQTSNAVQDVRERLAKCLGCHNSEIVYTSGGTESDNLAIIGAAYANRHKGNKIITSRIEHHAVLHACRHLEENGFKVAYLPVDGYGMVSPADLSKEMTDDTILVSVMAVNNEIGTVQPMNELARIAHEGGALFHTDAVQAIGKVPVDLSRSKVDLLSMAAHKFHGPKGVGALFIRSGTKISPIMFGGNHERGLRPSTENVPGIIGMGKALELTLATMDQDIARMRAYCDSVIDNALTSIPRSRLNGSREHRCSSIVNMTFPGIEGEALVIMLDREGFAVSTGSACSSKAAGPSHVLRAIGLDGKEARGSMRVSFSRFNTEEEVKAFNDVLPQVIERCRSLR